MLYYCSILCEIEGKFPKIGFLERFDPLNIVTDDILLVGCKLDMILIFRLR